MAAGGGQMPSLREQIRALRSRVKQGLDPAAHTPLWPTLPSGRWWASLVVPEEELERVDHMVFRDMGHGFDPLGLSRDGVAVGLLISHWLYHRWFRVTSHGIEHIPAEGPVVVAANHSGTIPLDGMMICGDILRKSGSHRVPRAVVDYFVQRMPFISTLFTRAGAIGGARGNFHQLLSHGELVVVFPEGTQGIGKPFSERYKLQRWTEGHAELAIRHGAPVVPVAVIGAEEQMPQLARLDWVHAFGSPFLPIPGTPMPLPVHYHIWYGEPIPVHEMWPPEAAQDPDAVHAASLLVRDAVEALIAKGLLDRAGVFA